MCLFRFDGIGALSRNESNSCCAASEVTRWLKKEGREGEVQCEGRDKKKKKREWYCERLANGKHLLFVHVPLFEVAGGGRRGISKKARYI